MDSSENIGRPNEPLHLSLGVNQNSAISARVNRRRSSIESAVINPSSGHYGVHRVDPYRSSTLRRNSGVHQPSYPTSARYYASNSSIPSSHAGNKGHHGHSKPSTQQFHHPLQHQVLPSSTYHATTSNSNRNRPVHANNDLFSQPQGLTAAVQYTLRIQAQKVAERIAAHSNGRSRRSKSSKGHDIFTSHSSKIDRLQNLFIAVFPIIMLIFVSHKVAKHAPLVLDNVTKLPEFKWKLNRRLNNRQCTLNMFVEKFSPDEFNPDFEEIKPGEKNKDGTPKLPTPVQLETGGTYRTKGQTAVIKRFISSVADSFRPQAKVQQHLLFTGARDGGHLAETALKFWPPRGEYITQLYVISDPHDDHAVIGNVTKSDHSNKALSYGALSAIEDRFQDHKLSDHVHIYDSHGQKAGLLRSDLDDDDIVQLKQEEMFGMEDDEVSSLDVFDDDAVLRKRSSVADEGPDYFSLKKLLTPFLDIEEDDPNAISHRRDESEKEKTKHTIPYFHVDGRSAAMKFDILRSARPLIQDKMIVTIGIENSPDLDVHDLIDFFRDVNFKTFALGKRQIMRIDHLCPEILDEVLSHPSIGKKREPRWYRKTLQKINIISPEKDSHIVHPHPENEILFPAFFVALPRGRNSKEEMTIQHMYDLFGGGGGGGQVATANDRKAPGKKKKKS